MIVSALQEMPWTRVDVSFQNARLRWMAHNLIQVMWASESGCSLVLWVFQPHTIFMKVKEGTGSLSTFLGPISRKGVDFRLGVGRSVGGLVGGVGEEQMDAW